MRRTSKILLALLFILIAIQFFRPGRNTSTASQPADITTVINVPAPVLQLLQRSCYDCHSNNTRYPWYMNIQPVAWYLAHHIDEGKAELNFNAFATYPAKKQLRKLQEIADEVEEGEMPLSSYTLLHQEAKLSPEEKTSITTWAKEATSQYPALPEANTTP